RRRPSAGKRWIAAGVAAVVLVGLGAGGALVLHRKQQEHDVRGSSNVEFVPGGLAAAKPEWPRVAWPTYGYDPERQRFANGISLAPPFKRVWTFRAQNLIE